MLPIDCKAIKSLASKNDLLKGHAGMSPKASVKRTSLPFALACLFSVLLVLLSARVAAATEYPVAAGSNYFNGHSFASYTPTARTDTPSINGALSGNPFTLTKLAGAGTAETATASPQNMPSGSGFPSSPPTHLFFATANSTYRYQFNNPLRNGTHIYFQDFDLNETATLSFFTCTGAAVDSSGFDLLRVTTGTPTVPTAVFSAASVALTTTSSNLTENLFAVVIESSSVCRIDMALTTSAAIRQYLSTPPADPSIQKSQPAPNPPVVGSPISWTLTATNNAATANIPTALHAPAVSGVTILDTVDAGVTGVTATITNAGGTTGGSCSVASNAVTCSGFSLLAASQSITVTISGTVSAGYSNPTLANTGTISITQPNDVNSGNNSSTVTTAVVGRVTLAKTWSNGQSGNIVSLTITGASVANAVAGTSTAPATTTNAIAKATPGSTVTLAEAFSAGSSANYTTTLACIRTFDSVAIVVTGSGLSRTITMPTDSGVACTYTNSRIGQQLRLVKTWANAIANDRVTVTTSGGTANASLDSTAPSTGLNGTAVTVYAGDVVTLPVETFNTGVQANYSTTLECTGGSPLGSGAAGRSVTILANTTATTCTYSNNRISFPVNLAKVWRNGAAGDQVSLEVSGGVDASAGSSIVGGATTDATASGLAGAITTLTEAFVAGLAASYNTTLACETAPGGTPVAVSGSGLSRTITMPNNSAVNCTWTNARPTFTLRKSWVNAIVGDAVNLTASGQTALASSASSATETDAGVTEGANIGASIDIAETFTTGDAANYTATLDCTGNANALSGNSVTVSASDTVIVCTMTNLLSAADLAIMKSNNVSPVEVGSTTYTLAVTNNGPASVTGAIVRDTPDSGLTCPGAGAVACSPLAVCAGPYTIADLTSSGGIALGTLNNGQTATLTFDCTVD